MADFSKINGRLFTGAAINGPDDVWELVRAGVDTVIDCRDDFDDGKLLAGVQQMLYLWNGTPDDGQPKSADWFKRSIDFALAALLSSPRHKVYCHCAAGVNRGPSTAFAILRALGEMPTLAEHEIRLVRPQVGLRYMADANNAIKVLGYE